MQVTRIALVGAGLMGELHAKALNDCDVTSLAGVVDPLVDRAENIAKFYDVPTYSSVASALSNTDIDAFIVAVPDTLHVDVTLEILHAGRHVFLEKPIAHTLDAAMELYSGSQKAPGRLTIAHILRHDTRFAGAREAVTNDEIGNILHVRGHRFVGSFVAKANGGRSPIWMYQGVHDIDLAQWISGHPIVEVQALTSRVLLDDLGVPGEDAAFVNYRLGNGALGSLHYSWVLPDNMPVGLYATFEITGSKGSATVDVQHQGLSIFSEAGYRQPDTAHWPNLNGRIVGDLVQEIRDFARSIREGTEFVMPLGDAVRAVAVIDAIGKSVESGAIETVKQPTL